MGIVRDEYADIAERYDIFERADDAVATFFRQLFGSSTTRTEAPVS